VVPRARAALEESLAGAGQLLLISGEPGIGKSAVLSQLTADAAARGARVLRGACWDGGTPAYWPWTQVLRAAVGPGPDRLEPADLGTAARLLTGGTTSDAPAVVDPADPGEARFLLLDGVGEGLARLSARLPVVVTVDDLQWADEPSLRLLDFLAHRLAAHPVLLLGAYRDAEAGPAMREVGAGRPHLPLLGLGRADVPALVRQVADPEQYGEPPENVVADIWRRSAGNPFLVRELTRLIVAQGGWPAGGGRGANTSPVSSVPDAVRDTLERRLARLSQPCAEMLAVAAVIGAEVREDVLARIVSAGPDRRPLADLLAEAAEARVLASPSAPGAGHRFSHDLYRETVLSGLLPARRRDVHLRVARALAAAREAGAEVHPAEIAEQFLAAGSAEAAAEAVQFSVAAAHEALRKLGYEEACRHLERALTSCALLPDGAPDQRLELLLALADARFRAGDRLRARADLAAAVELSRRLADPVALARAAVALHGLGTRGASREAVATATLLTEASAALPPEPSAVRARVLTALVRSMRHQGPGADPEAIVAAGHEAVDVARAVGEPAVLAHALLALHDAVWQPGSGPARLEVLGEMDRAARAAGERDLVAQCAQLRAAALLESGSPRGRSELARYVVLMEEAGHARGRWEALTRRATLAAIEGRTTEADRLATEALALGRALGEPDAAGVHGTLRGSLLLVGGVPGTPQPSPADVEQGAPTPAYLPLLLAVPLLERGDVPAARQLLAGVAVDEVVPLHDLEALALLASVIAPGGSDVQRTRVYERLAPFAGLHVVVGGCASYWGVVDHHLAALASSLGRRDAAAAHLAAAIDAYARLGAPVWAEHCRDTVAALAPATPAAPANGERPEFRFDGGSWELAFRDRQVHVPDAKGIRDLAVLLAEPGRPVHVLRLLGADETSGADPVLDDRAKTAYRARLVDLDAEIDEAREWRDPARAERAEAERQALIAELAAAAGLRGRSRRLGDPTERARKTVTARIRDALRRIDQAHPPLGEHLRATVTTGTSCCYTPQDG
jgi:hypothetical protein